MKDPADKRKLTGRIQKMEMYHFSKQYCFIKPSKNLNIDKYAPKNDF